VTGAFGRHVETLEAGIEPAMRDRRISSDWTASRVKGAYFPRWKQPHRRPHWLVGTGVFLARGGDGGL